MDLRVRGVRRHEVTRLQVGLLLGLHLGGGERGTEGVSEDVSSVSAIDVTVMPGASRQWRGHGHVLFTVVCATVRRENKNTTVGKSEEKIREGTCVLQLLNSNIRAAITVALLTLEESKEA